MFPRQEEKKMSVGESNFWLNLGSLLEKRGSKMGSEEESEKINNWLQALMKAAEVKGDKEKKRRGSEKEERKRQSIVEEGAEIENADETESKNEKVVPEEPPKHKQVQRSFTNLARRKGKRKKKRKSNLKYFGPTFDITFNLPKVSQQLERLMGSSVVRLTDRKYMLDLQKRIEEDYHDTLMKRISSRQASEIERERRMGNGLKRFSKKEQSLLMRNRDNLKTVRSKNAEELIKQGKRWERVRHKMCDQELVNEIETRKEREKMLENRTLYIFDPMKADLSGMDLTKLKSRKFTESEIDLKNFLLSEKDNRLIKRIREEERRDFLKVQETMRAATLSVTTPTALRSQDVSSFEDTVRDEGVNEEKIESVKVETVDVKPEEETAKLKKFEFIFRRTGANMKRSRSRKDDEDPQIEEFQNAETVAELYALADEIITADARKNKLLKHIKIIKKSLKTNMALLKGAQ